MDNPKLDKIKKIIPVKGRLRNNLLKELKESQSVENGSIVATNNKISAKSALKVKEPLTSPENKIIIQKVEICKLEIIKTNSKAPPRRISSLFTSNEDHNQSESIVQENTTVQSEILEKPPEPFQSNIEGCNSSVKLLSAKIPDNSCNTSIPLKMIRTIKAAKAKPNLLPRIHRVETTKSPEPSVVPPADSIDYSSVKFEVLLPHITMTEEESQVAENTENNVSVLPKAAENTKTELNFSGFDRIDANEKCDIGLWEDVMANILEHEEPLKHLETSARTQDCLQSSKKNQKLFSSSSGPCQRFEIKIIKSPPRISEQNTKLPNGKSIADKNKLKMSSSSKKYLDLLSEKSPPLESASTVKKSFSKAPSLSSEKTTTKIHLKMDIADSLIKTSSNEQLEDSSTSRASIPSTSKNFQNADKKPKVDEADWMEDILTVIGTSRIEKIDESLKEIPNLITGNFSAIETENVEFKLIIKHLLRELGVESIMDTVKFSSKNGSTSISIKKDDDDDDDFTESFDDDSNEPSNYTEDSNTNEQTFEQDPCRNCSNLPSTSHTFATSFGEIPSFSLQSENFSPESKPFEPDLQAQKTVVLSKIATKKEINRAEASFDVLMSYPTVEMSLIEDVDISDTDKKAAESSTNRKRKNDATSPSHESTPLSKKKRSKQAIPWNLLLNGDLRRKSLRSSSRESSAEPASKLEQTTTDKNKEIEQNVVPFSPTLSSRRESSFETFKKLVNEKLSKKRRPEKLTIKSEERRSSPRIASRESSAEPKVLGQSLKKTDERKDSDNEGIRAIQRTTRMRPLKPLTDDSDTDEINNASRNDSCSDDSDTPLVKKISVSRANNDNEESKNRRGRKPKNAKSKKTCKTFFDSDSEPSTKIFDAARKKELESRLAPSLDSDSNHKSPMPNVHFKSSDKRAARTQTEMNSMMEKFAKTIAKQKDDDPSYIDPPIMKKRPRLRTSAFKGSDNDNECSNDEDIQKSFLPNTDGPSVSSSRASSRASSAERKNKSPNLQGRMKNLVEKDKQKLSPKKFFQVKETPEKGRSRKVPETSIIAKKVFVQEPLEAAIESKVPYEKILQSIKASSFAKRIGRTSKKLNKEDEIRKEESSKGLRSLKFFRCGSCGFEVTKHKWEEHFLEHGGLAWIEGFDAPILLTDWNEAIRRTIHSFRIYNQISMKCPNCSQAKRSALGHLSHVLICGETETAVDSKKVACVHCNERLLPFNISTHKSKCSGLATVVQQVADGDGEDEHESDKDEVSSESFNLSGRQKRKAVTKAEKKFKKIIENLSGASDHLQIVRGEIKCHICGETNFVSKKEALDHIKDQHSSSLNEEDVEASDSDVSIKAEESSEETEGSSGVESSEIEESDGENDEVSDNDKLISSKKARQSATEPQEVRHGRALISEYVDSIRNKIITLKTIQWTREFAYEKWKDEMLPQHIPRLLPVLSQDPKDVLPSLKFKLKSCFFGTRQVDSYSSNLDLDFKKEWKQLEIGEHDASEQATTIHCGGSVSAIDWAPTSGDLSFLAVACNSCSKGIKMDLEETISSCVQLHEFKNLENDNFQGFQKTSKLCYIIIIKDGPIWSIKFHPSESSLEKRVGLLAVATSNQSVLIYSLPYQSGNKSIVLPISPNVICNLKKDEVPFNQKYLQQASRLSWFVKNGNETILAAGYISGKIAVWNVSDCLEDKENSYLYPRHVIQAHLESITALDFKATSTSDFHLMTASLDRKIKVFTFDEFRYQEISCHYAVSRILWAEWWLHWPGFIVGFDDCFTYGSILHRQPLEFGSRNSPMLAVSSSIVHFNINHWLNFVMLVSDSGDVLGCQPGQMLQTYPKDKWSYFNFNMFSSTGFNKVTKNGTDEIGIVFSDYKNSISQPKKYRLASVDRINELLINQICFNQNEKSYRFYALGYETGFVRIRYLKTSK